MVNYKKHAKLLDSTAFFNAVAASHVIEQASRTEQGVQLLAQHCLDPLVEALRFPVNPSPDKTRLQGCLWRSIRHLLHYTAGIQALAPHMTQLLDLFSTVAAVSVDVSDGLPNLAVALDRVDAIVDITPGSEAQGIKVLAQHGRCIATLLAQLQVMAIKLEHGAEAVLDPSDPEMILCGVCNIAGKLLSSAMHGIAMESPAWWPAQQLAGGLVGLLVAGLVSLPHAARCALFALDKLADTAPEFLAPARTMMCLLYTLLAYVCTKDLRNMGHPQGLLMEGATLYGLGHVVQAAIQAWLNLKHKPTAEHMAISPKMLGCIIDILRMLHIQQNQEACIELGRYLLSPFTESIAALLVVSHVVPWLQDATTCSRSDARLRQESVSAVDRIIKRVGWAVGELQKRQLRVQAAAKEMAVAFAVHRKLVYGGQVLVLAERSSDLHTELQDIRRCMGCTAAAGL